MDAEPVAPRRATLPDRVAVGASILLVAWLTLVPVAAPHRASPPLCVTCGDLAAVDALLNVLLFVPLGAALRRVGVARRRVVLAALASSVAIELLQRLVVPGRDPALRDVLANTAGAALGALLADHAARLLHPTVRGARLLFGAHAALVLLLATLAARAAEPMLPVDAAFGQWAPRDVYPADFGGAVRAVTVDGVSLEPGRVPDPAELRRRLAADPLDVHLVIVSGLPTPALASIAGVLDAQRREWLLVGQKGRDLVFRVGSRAAGWRLRPAGVRWRDALPAQPGRRLELSLIRQAGRVTLRVDGEGESVRTVAASPGAGWLLFLPSTRALDAGGRIVSALWLGVLLLPLGYWAAHATRRRPGPPQLLAATVLVGAVAGASLAGVARLAGIPPASLPEWIGAAAGAALGWWLGVRTRRWARAVAHAPPSRAATSSTARATRA